MLGLKLNHVCKRGQRSKKWADTGLCDLLTQDIARVRFGILVCAGSVNNCRCSARVRKEVIISGVIHDCVDIHTHSFDPWWRYGLRTLSVRPRPLRGMRRPPVASSHQGPVMQRFFNIFFVFDWTSSWTNSRVANDLRRHDVYAV